MGNSPYCQPPTPVEALNGGQFTLSTQLIPLPTQHRSSFQKLPPISKTIFITYQIINTKSDQLQLFFLIQKGKKRMLNSLYFNSPCWELRLKGPNTKESCKPSFTQVLNRVHCGPFQANVCMKSLTEETVSQNDYLVYEFEIDAEPTGSDVTYKYDHFCTIKCL